MTRKILALTIMALMAAVVFAQNKTVTITGNLIDNACAGSAGDKLDARATSHATSCAIMDGCEKSGYAVYSDKKLYKLDDKGNDGAADILKNTKTAKGVKVTVEGTLDGNTIHVTKITEVAAATN